MKRFFAVFFAAAVLFTLSACETAPPEPLSSFAFTPDNFPRIDGSTATIPLGEAVTAVLLGIPRETAAEMTQFSNTNTAFTRLSSGEADVLIVYEPPAETLEQYADEFLMTPIGRDALVFLVNANNPVRDLSEEEILGVYTGGITDWAELGGNAGAIVPYQRNETSGSQTMFRKLVTGERELAPAPAHLIVGGMGDLIAAVASYENSENAIGYNVYFYVTQMKADPNIGILSVGGVVPDSETIMSGEYPYVNDFFAVIRAGEPDNSPARALYEWLQGSECRELMKRENYVPAAER